MNMNRFAKLHGLGNDYIVLAQNQINFELTEKVIETICDVHFGIGSDGILLKVDSDSADYGLRIFNSDGSEAEKSGNGLRIFAKYLYDCGHSRDQTFSIETKGGIVYATIIKTGTRGKALGVSVDMGKAIFQSRTIPVDFDKESVIGGKLQLADAEYEINCVSVGNPHCVVLKDTLDEDEIKKYGPLIEKHPLFPNRINVQFAKVLSRSEAEILIWERGSGFTLASGSSSCAVAAVLRKRGLIDQRVKIRMAGGQLNIEIDDQWNIKMTGDVREIAEGRLSPELIEDAT